MLDIRFILGICLVSLIVALAFHAAFQETPPPLPRLKPWRLRLGSGKSRSIVAIFLLPFVSIANVFLMAVSVVVDLIVKVSTISAHYLLRLGKHSAAILREVVIEKRGGWHTLRFTCLFLLILFIVLLVKAGIEPSLAYLRSSEWATEFPNLIHLSIITFLIIPCAAGVYGLKNERFRLVHQPTAFGLAIVLAILLVAGGLVHGLCRSDAMRIVGFNGVGPYTILILILSGAGAAKLLLFDKEEKEVLSKDAD